VIDFVEAFKKTSITIPTGHFEDVKAVKGLGWMNPSAVGGFLGFKTFHVIVQTDDGKKIVDFKSQHDQSWIVTGSGVVRQKYGAGLFVQDLSTRQYPWGAESTPAPRPVAKNNGYLWCVQNGTNRPLTFWRHDEAGFISDVTNRKGTVEPSEDPKLAAGATNDWTASWEVTLPPSSSPSPPPPPQGSNDAFGMNFGIDTYTNESRGLAFHIPRKFARGSEMKVIIKEKDESELIIEYPEHRTKPDSTEGMTEDPVYIKRTFHVLNKRLPQPDYGTLREKPEFPNYDAYRWRITNGRGGSPDDSTHDISVQAGEENSVGQDGYGYPSAEVFDGLLRIVHGGFHAQASGGPVRKRHTIA